MNVFYVDADPEVAARSLCDKHVSKMCLESAQIVSTVVRETLSVTDAALYKSTHVNHPIVQWTGKATANFLWVAIHGLALSDEWQFRYVHDNPHKSAAIILQALQYLPALDKVLKGWRSVPPACMPAQYRNAMSTIASYRNYYHKVKAYMAKWEKGRKPPYWWSQRTADLYTWNTPEHNKLVSKYIKDMNK